MHSSPASTEQRIAALFCHASGFFGLWLLGPGVVYLAQRRSSEFVARHALHALLVQLATALLLTLAAAVIWLLFAFVWTQPSAGNVGLGRLPELMMSLFFGVGPVVALYLLATAIGAFQGLSGKAPSWPVGRLIEAIRR